MNCLVVSLYASVNRLEVSVLRHLICWYQIGC